MALSGRRKALGVWVLAAWFLIAGCGGGERASTNYSASPAANAVSVKALSFVPPDGMRRREVKRQGVGLEMIKESPAAQSPSAKLQVFVEGRDVGGIEFRIMTIKAYVRGEAPTATFGEPYEIEVPGAYRATVLPSRIPSAEADYKQVHVVVATSSGPQYGITYAATVDAYDKSGYQRMLDTLSLETR